MRVFAIGRIRMFVVAVLCGAVTAALTVVVGIAPAAAVSLTIKGQVTCSAKHTVRGIWVYSSGGGSRFADFTRVPGYPWKANYTKTLSTATPTNVQLHVGCGGTSSSWWSNNRTYNTKLTGSATRNVRCSDSKSGTHYSCKYILADSANPFDDGNCTWGAAKKWGENTGAYPNWRGDAKYWATSAASKGWKVSATPRTRTIVVIQPGPWPLSSASAGHVAWVNRVNTTTREMNITDMNGKAGFGKWATYDRPLHSSMRFIYPP